MAHLILTASDHDSVLARISSREPLFLRVRLESDGLPQLVAQLRRDRFVRAGGCVVPEGQRVHATFMLSRYLSLTVPAVAGEVTVQPSGEGEQAFQFVPDEPEIIDVLMSSAMPDDVVH